MGGAWRERQSRWEELTGESQEIETERWAGRGRKNGKEVEGAKGMGGPGRLTSGKWARPRENGGEGEVSGLGNQSPL